jgi:hypothetical protein
MFKNIHRRNEIVMARREVSGFQIAVPDEDHPSHITYDFAPTFKRLHELGLQEMLAR